MTILDDDINHLLLSCHLSSELASGLRYAYARLDTIDRKASELFRSFTWALGLLGGLAALLRHALFPGTPGNPSPAQTSIVILFVILTPIAIRIVYIHREISSLRYYRMGVVTLDAALRLNKDKFVASDPAVRSYLNTISAVTVSRETKLAEMAAWHTTGLIFAAILLVVLIVAASPEAQCLCTPAR